MSDFEKCSNWLQLELILLLVNLPFEFGQVMTRYDLLEAGGMILSNVQTNSNLLISLFNFHMDWGQ